MPALRTVIEDVRPSAPQSSLRRPSSVRLAADAGRRVLETTGAADRIDLVINVGVYRDGHICEPALAPLIQRRIASLAQRKDVFSLDLMNGGCGLVNALQVVDTFVRTGSVRRALVVASDVDPDPRRSSGLAVRPAGVAIVAGAVEGPEGFLAFHSETFTEYAGLYEGRVDWLGPRGWLTGGAGHAVAVRTDESYTDRCAACAAASATRFLAAQGLAIGDIDLVVAPDSPCSFAGAFSAMLQLDRRCVIGGPASAGAHSAAPGLALSAAMASGRLRAARRTLLVAAGAGITVALALYGGQDPTRGA